MNPILRKVIGENGDLEPTGVDPQQIAQDRKVIDAMLDEIHQRFVREKIEGYKNPKTGQQTPPVTPEEAEQRWQMAAPTFRRILKYPKPALANTVKDKFGIHSSGDELRYAHHEVQ